MAQQTFIPSLRDSKPKLIMPADWGNLLVVNLLAGLACQVLTLPKELSSLDLT